MNHSSSQPSVPDNDKTPVRSTLKFPVVGIGASAGGVGALIKLFENMPESNGMAFVVVLHLSPAHESSAAQVLQRATRMPVSQVTVATLIERDHVYIIAPQKQLSMNDGHLIVTPLKKPRGQHTAIDIFFRTLADVHRERAIAIVLSGAGADGAVGISRIKEQGGVTLAQLASDAEHDGMPNAAAATGVIDFILPVVEIPQKLTELWENSSQITLPPLNDGEELEVKRPNPDEAAEAEDALREVISLLCKHTGHDFRHYKRATVLRRIERRMQVRSASNLPDYRKILEGDLAENTALLKDMLIGVTNFFRDREAFDSLERDILPELFKNRTPGEEIRAWVTACSSGEEAYSIAILLAEQAELANADFPLQVFASDVDDQAIAVARRASFPASIIADVTPGRLRQFFTKDGERYHIRKNIRDSVLFASHNLLRDPPFSKLDLITCRNLLIYLNRDVQLRLLETFHSILKPDGILFLGSSESAEAVSDFFVAVDKKNRIYRARPASRSARLVQSLSPAPRADHISKQKSENRLQPSHSYADLHYRALVVDAPPSVIVDEEHNILHMCNNAGTFFRFGAGEPSRNILDIVASPLRLDLRTALYQAKQTGKSGPTAPTAIPSNDGLRIVQMRTKSIKDDAFPGFLTLVTFEYIKNLKDAPPSSSEMRRDQHVLIELEAELQRNRQHLKETVEHAEISNEELRASNEELQAINEELRSATDELETSKEELQSVNEELITVNYELKLKVDETSKANDDLNNLIASTNIATVFVDKQMCIKRFTPRAADIFRIMNLDIGRSLLDLTHRLDYEDLANDIASTFETLLPVEREVRQVDGRCYIVRLQPYRTNDDKIEGAVMTFFDITARRQVEKLLRQGEERMRLVADSTKDYSIITMDTDGLITSWNKGAERMFGYKENEVLGQPVDVIYTPEDRQNEIPRRECERARIQGDADDERWHMRKDGSRFFCGGVTTPLQSDTFYGYAKIARDQTDRLQNERLREAALNHEQVERTNAVSANAMKDEFLAVMSHELRHPLNVISINAEMLTRMPAIKLSSACSKAVDVIRNSVSSQSKIIEDLLDMSRLHTGKFTLNRRTVDIAELVKSIVAVAVADPAALELQINTSIGDRSILVDADPVRIEQIVLNLLSNAIKFTPPGGQIHIQLTEEGEQARLDVTDDGKGISPDFIPHVFEMFGQNGVPLPRATKSGLGIGLALVQQIAELHGGQVKASSPGLGLGAQFTVWIPLSATHSLPIEDENIDENILHGLRVVVVDDSQDMLLMFKDLLEMDGAIVTTANNSLDGLKLLLETDAQLLMSDISMPGASGYDFIREVRKQPRLSELAAIAISGLGRDEDVALALDAGYSAHLCKPISIDTLYAKIVQLLR